MCQPAGVKKNTSACVYMVPLLYSNFWREAVGVTKPFSWLGSCWFLAGIHFRRFDRIRFLRNSSRVVLNVDSGGDESENPDLDPVEAVPGAKLETYSGFIAVPECLFRSGTRPTEESPDGCYGDV